MGSREDDECNHLGELFVNEDGGVECAYCGAYWTKGY